MNLRLQRVCELLKRELGTILLKNLQFGGALVTVSGVDITPDLKQAHVFVSVLGTPADRRKAMEELEREAVPLQRELMKRVTLKHSPHLNFKLDDSIERGTRVIELMDELGLKAQPFSRVSEASDDEGADDEEGAR
jgi:ribosome-binding factor A